MFVGQNLINNCLNLYLTLQIFPSDKIRNDTSEVRPLNLVNNLMNKKSV
jgi:hypothetical protein